MNKFSLIFEIYRLILSLFSFEFLIVPIYIVRITKQLIFQSALLSLENDFTWSICSFFSTSNRHDQFYQLYFFLFLKSRMTFKRFINQSGLILFLFPKIISIFVPFKFKIYIKKN